MVKETPYQQGRTFKLSDVVLKNNNLYKIGNYFFDKSEGKPVCTIEFLKGFVTTNKLNPIGAPVSKLTKHDLSKYIVDAVNKRDEVVAVVADDDEDDEIESTNEFTKEAREDELLEAMRGLQLGGSPTKLGRQDIQNYQNKKLNLQQTQLIITLTKEIKAIQLEQAQIRQTYANNDAVREVLEKEAECMLQFYWAKRNELMKDNAKAKNVSNNQL